MSEAKEAIIIEYQPEDDDTEELYRRIPKETAPPKVTLMFCPPTKSRK